MRLGEASMSLSLSDIVQIFNFAEHVRPWLPWTWRVYSTSWLIWSGILAIAALLCLCLHFAFKERQKVEWRFLSGAPPFSASWGVQDDGTIIDYKIIGIELTGENVSGHALHQISGRITLRDKRSFPLFVVADGEWVRTEDVEPIGRFAIVNLGGSFKTDGLGWPEFSDFMKPEQFIQSFGGCTISVTIDGDEQHWTFSVEDLRQAVQSQSKQLQEAQLRGPMRPNVHKKK
jgi:hypothetical protein